MSGRILLALVGFWFAGYWCRCAVACLNDFKVRRSPEPAAGNADAPRSARSVSGDVATPPAIVIVPVRLKPGPFVPSPFEVSIAEAVAQTGRMAVRLPTADANRADLYPAGGRC